MRFSTTRNGRRRRPRAARGAASEFSARSAAPNAQHHAGFSLIEVMVATAILMVVVLMVGSIFTQASSAWDSGYSHAEGGAALRGVAGALTRDLQTAVDMRDFFPNETAPIVTSGSSIEFVSLKINDRQPGDSATSSEGEAPREFVRIKYTVTDGKVQREESKLKRTTNSGAPKWEKGDTTTTVLWNGSSSSASGSSGGSSFEAGFSMTPIEIESDQFDNRPYNAADAEEANWAAEGDSTVVGVKLRMELKTSGAFSSLHVTSYGRDGLPNSESKNKDDILAY